MGHAKSLSLGCARRSPQSFSLHWTRGDAGGITLVATVSFSDLGRIAGIAGSSLALATIEGQIVQPLLVGRRLAVNPLVVFLSLWFGGLFWGIAGIVLATPTLLAIKVVAAQSARGAALLEFLGPNKDVMEREQRLRELARRVTD